jgi:hypothetical protein
MLSEKISKHRNSLQQILGGTTLQHKGRSSLWEHVDTMGPSEWTKTKKEIINKNRTLGLAFQSIAEYLTKLETSPEDWHVTPI